MGSGASAGVTAAVSAASLDDLQQALAGLPEDTKAKLQAALGAVKPSARPIVATLVSVCCKEGTDGDFCKASVENAKNSVNEADNLRFDVFQSKDKGTDCVLVETYATPEGPPEHKKTPHYNAWRETVADWMDKPREGVKYNVLFPDAAGLKPAADGGDAVEPDVTFVHCVTKAGTASAFIEESLKNAKGVWASEPDVLRFDLLQHCEDENKFLLVEVYKSADAVKAHKEKKHYLEWREKVGDMMEVPRQAKKYTAHYPSTAAGWRKQ